MTSRILRAQLRIISLVAAFCFAALALVAPALHSHDHLVAGVASSTAHACTQVHTSSPDASGAVLTQGEHQTAAGCVLCLWLSDACYSAPVALNLLWFATSVAALLLLAVRLAELCSRPAPSRGFRAPPVFAF